MLGHSYDAKVDLWSVGVILYGIFQYFTFNMTVSNNIISQETLFGMAPFASKTFEELEEKVLDVSPVKVCSLNMYLCKCICTLDPLLRFQMIVVYLTSVEIF